MRVTYLIVLLAALLLVSCGPAAPNKGDLYVYVAAPLSGWQADGGQTVVGGARLAADEINKNGGLLGYRLQIVPLDDEADSDVAVLVAEQIRADVQAGKRVLGVIGHYNSGQCAAALPIYADLPLIVITPTASDPSLTEQGYTRFFRVNATDAAQGPYDAEFLVNDLGKQRIVVVYAENDYGRGLKDQMVAALERLGRPAVAVIGIEEAAPSQAAVIPAIKQANPDAVFLAGYETEGYVLLPELREAGVDVTFMASDGCFLYDFVDGSGQWAEGAYVSGITPDPKVVADATWWREYQQVEGRNPGPNSVGGYSAMRVMAQGVIEAKTLGVDAVGAAIRGLSLTTLIGPVHYDAKGDLTEQRIYVFQVRDNDFVQVKPTE
jgi:branched-chain amino acid transport system substrate-binding protein